MKELIVGLVLAGASGMTFLAYKHPKAYAEIYGALIIGITGGLGFVIGIYVGGSAMFKHLIPLIPTNQTEAATKAADVATPDLVLIGSLYLAALGYLLFLRLLHFLLKEDQK
jgi:hypothetical protein